MSLFADPLASAAMLLAALTMVFTAWSGSIQVAIDREDFASAVHERNRQKAAIRRIRNWRARPLAIAATAMFALYFARDCAIVASVWDYWHGDGSKYDDVAAAFLLTQVCLLGLLCHFWAQAHRLSKQL